MLSRIEAKIIKISQAFFFFLVWMLHYLIFLPFLRIKIEGKENIPKKGRLIIAGNHQNFFDGFLLTYATGPFRKISFLIAKRAIKSKFFQLLGMLMGAVLMSDGPEEYQRALKKLNRILMRGGTIGIFPEGDVTKNKLPRKFKGGVSKLSYDSNTKVLPVSLKGTYEIRYLKYWLKRPQILIKIGKPIELYNYVRSGNNLDEAAAVLREKIIELMNLNDEQSVAKINMYNVSALDSLGRTQQFNKI